MPSASLRHALLAARAVTGSTETNTEFARGQVSLITNLFGIYPDESNVAIITEVVTSQISLESGIACLNANNRRFKELTAPDTSSRGEK